MNLNSLSNIPFAIYFYLSEPRCHQISCKFSQNRVLLNFWRITGKRVTLGLVHFHAKMSDCKKYAIFVWINDDPVTGRVLKLSNITHPRRDYDEYFEGQEVDAKCPGFGINKAVIGKISGEFFFFFFQLGVYFYITRSLFQIF